MQFVEVNETYLRACAADVCFVNTRQRACSRRPHAGRWEQYSGQTGERHLLGQAGDVAVRGCLISCRSVTVRGPLLRSRLQRQNRQSISAVTSDGLSGQAFPSELLRRPVITPHLQHIGISSDMRILGGWCGQHVRCRLVFEIINPPSISHVLFHGVPL
jgi:hypothetical protein